MGGGDHFSLPTKPVGDGRHMDAMSQLMPRQRKPSLLFHPRVLGSLSFSPLKLLPQIRVAWRQFLLAVSIPNENSAPSITSITIISNSPRLSIPRLIADLQATTLHIFLPVASYFHNMNVVKCTMSKLPLGEETSNLSIFFGLLFQFAHEYQNML